MSVQHLPHHVAIIMDGNRRWAKGRGITTARGHFLGIQNIVHIIDSSLAARVPILSLYAFSTENWNRAKKEVSVLMNLMHYFLKQEIESMHRKGVQVNVIGIVNELPTKV